MGIATAAGLLACPVCRDDVTVVDRTLRCGNGHGFDLARQGYANLLGGAEPANADTSAMLAARARIHAAGIFGPLAAEVAGRVQGRTTILEVGSGTAYYLAAALGEDPMAVGVALDVSKAAAKVAARTDRRIAAVVADVWRPLPLRDRCLEAALCVFAPRNLPEFARVLRPDGVLVVATPRPGHLAGLRDRHGLLDVPGDKAEAMVAAASEFFSLVDTRLVRRRLPVTTEQAEDLIAMGPNAFHRVPEDVAAGEVTIDITVQTFRQLSS